MILLSLLALLGIFLLFSLVIDPPLSIDEDEYYYYGYGEEEDDDDDAKGD